MVETSTAGVRPRALQPPYTQRRNFEDTQRLPNAIKQRLSLFQHKPTEQELAAIEQSVKQELGIPPAQHLSMLEHMVQEKWPYVEEQPVHSYVAPDAPAIMVQANKPEPLAEPPSEDSELAREIMNGIADAIAEDVQRFAPLMRRRYVCSWRCSRRIRPQLPGCTRFTTQVSYPKSSGAFPRSGQSAASWQRISVGSRPTISTKSCHGTHMRTALQIG